MDITTNPLLTDLYQLNMMQAYLDHGETGTAVFEFFVRDLPPRRGFLVAAGLQQALDFLENVRFAPDDIDWLARSGRFGASLLDHLADFRFTGDVLAMPEGTAFFAGEPLLRVTAPLPAAQLVESRLVNILHFQTLVAAKAARMTLAAPGKTLIDFGLRRAHGAEAGLMAARASYLAGFAGSATVLAEELFGIPTFGTMAHSFIQIYDDETVAFEDFARSRPQSVTLLIDTYDTEAGARKVAALAPRLAALGIKVRAVRIDSGDLVVLARAVRAILDTAGLAETRIVASGGLDEDSIGAMVRVGAPIDEFGVGTSLTTSSDAPSLDCVYKLQEYDGIARRKRSAGKATWPGRKQVWRRYGPDGRMAQDVVSLERDAQAGEPLLHQVMQGGRRTGPQPTLRESRARAARDLERLPAPLQRLEPGAIYRVEVADALVRLAAEVDDRLARNDTLT
jgi:nicotinate phosphoribosyltransferase